MFGTVSQNGTVVPPFEHSRKYDNTQRVLIFDIDIDARHRYDDIIVHGMI